jgi:O-antigen/teichoic acid export membrane protein
MTACALAVAAPIAIPLLFTSEFTGAVPVAVVLSFGMVLRNVVQMAQNLMMGVGRPGVVMYSEWAGLATLLGLILFLAPRFGLNGVAAAVVAGNTVALSIALWMFTRWSRSPAGPVNPEVEG